MVFHSWTFSGLTAVITFLFVHLPSIERRGSSGLVKTVWELDPIGTLVFVPSIVCLLLALQVSH